MHYFDKHVFFCTNQREDGSTCCANHGAQNARDYMKVKASTIPRHDNNIRINSAGCLDRCEEGPVMVIYPEGIWYTYVDESDLDEIVEEHLKNNRIVERLKLK